MPNYWYHHIHVVSPDIEKAAQFYERMFGAKVVSTGQMFDGRTNISLDLNGSRILVANRKFRPDLAPTPSETGYCHLGLRTDNLEAAVDELKVKGVEFVREGKPSFLLGPENTLIELISS